MVALKGLEKFAPKDFPGHIASTVFVAGCNFRCPYCHNPDLILRPQTLADIPPDFFLAYLDTRKGWLEGICVSGGEPLLAEGLEELLMVLRERGLLIKIDTNGSCPDRLAALLKAGLVDRVAVDIKAAPARYPEVTRSKADFAEVARTIDLLKTTGLPALFRTTVVPGLVGADDVRAIAELLDGSAAYQIQAFSPSNTLDPEMAKVKPYPREEVLAFAEIARPHFGDVRVEGVA